MIKGEREAEIAVRENMMADYAARIGALTELGEENAMKNSDEITELKVNISRLQSEINEIQKYGRLLSDEQWDKITADSVRKFKKAQKGWQ